MTPILGWKSEDPFLEREVVGVLGLEDDARPLVEIVGLEFEDPLAVDLFPLLNGFPSMISSFSGTVSPSRRMKYSIDLTD